MTKEAIIQKTVKALNILPEEKAEEIFEFVEFISKKYEDQILQKEIETLQSNGNAFNFLNEEEDLYSADDIKQKF